MDDSWEKKYGLGEGHSVLQLPGVGYAATGFVETGNRDALLLKTNSSGNEIWKKSYGGSNADYGKSLIKVAGGFVIAGYTWSYGAGSSDAWLIKTNDDGNQLWAKTYGGSDLDAAYSVKQTTDSGYIIAGYTYSYGYGDADMWLIKTNSDGNEAWNMTYGGSNADFGYSVLCLADGYLIVGYTESYGYGNDILLVKTDGYGNKLWNKTLGGENVQEVGYSIKTTNDGGFIIAGYSYADDNKYVLLAKVNSDGNAVWAHTYGGSNYDGGYSAQQTLDGGYVVTGYTYSYGHAGGTSDGWLIKTNSSGAEQWNTTFGGTSNDVCYDVQQTPNKGYIITGYTTGEIWLIRVAGENYAPAPPSIDGPPEGKAGTEYTYTFNTTDSNDDEVSYFVDWGDNTSSGWTDYVPPGTEVALKHTWAKQGTYTIKAKAKDPHDAESDWGTMEVTMPRNRAASNPLLLRFLERFPHVFQILRHLML